MGKAKSELIFGRMLLGILTVGIIVGIYALATLAYLLFIDIGFKLILILIGIYVIGLIIDKYIFG